MQEIKDFNKVPQEILDQCIPQFKDGEVVEFRLVGGRYDVDKKQHLFGSQLSWHLQGRIKTGNGKYVRIGVPEVIENEEVKRVKLFQLTSVGDNEFIKGPFHLTYDGQENIEIIEFLLLSDANGKKPGRDTSKPVIYEYVDRKVEAKSRIQRTSKLTVALMTADNMGLADRRAFAAGMNWNTSEDEDVLHAKIYEYAQGNPEDFMQRVGDKNTKLKSLLKGAMDRGIINFVPEKYAFAWPATGTKDGQTIGLLERKEGFSEIDAMAAWIEQAKNGADIQKAIQNKYNALLRDEAKGE